MAIRTNAFVPEQFFALLALQNTLVPERCNLSLRFEQVLFTYKALGCPLPDLDILTQTIKTHDILSGLKNKGPTFSERVENTFLERQHGLCSCLGRPVHRESGGTNRRSCETGILCGFFLQFVG
jgi:hypothetical protein